MRSKSQSLEQVGLTQQGRHPAPSPGQGLSLVETLLSTVGGLFRVGGRKGVLFPSDLHISVQGKGFSGLKRGFSESYYGGGVGRSVVTAAKRLPARNTVIRELGQRLAVTLGQQMRRTEAPVGTHIGYKMISTLKF